MRNLFKTFVLLLAMTLLLMLIGEWIGGQRGMMTAFVLAAVMNLGTYWFSDKIVLAMYGARDPRPDERRVVALVAGLANQAGLPSPRVKVMDTQLPNAFATGRNPQHAVVAVTTGILEALNDRELTAVLAHELTHVKNRDILIGAIAATLAGAISMIARMAFWFGGDRDNRNVLGGVLMLILAPLAAFMIQMAVSRSREFAADRGAAEITRHPMDLVAALKKIHAAVKFQPMPQTASGNATAHLFIVNPFKLSGLASLFSTHPSLEQRAERLQALEREMHGVLPNA